jgi:transposase
LFDAHTHCLAALGGVPQRGIYDNMKTAVDRVGRGKARVVSSRSKAMASHFLFEAEFCSPGAGREKGQGEHHRSELARRAIPADAHAAAV